ncbi:uncharacterized protein UBRO_20747 [Ustilago bromivora]|uniref:Uncharacterized protein n=1 Tax=Ustilago bromivora TaxID=307758 RepID=A0A1K0G6L0_9BASI|nr:uncharacterized protein UBRO_20747 [Ustilago bromivora]
MSILPLHAVTSSTCVKPSPCVVTIRVVLSSVPFLACDHLLPVSSLFPQWSTPPPTFLSFSWSSAQTLGHPPLQPPSTAHLPPAQPSPALPARIGEYQSAITYLRLSVDLIDKVNQDTVGIYDPPEASRAIVAWCYSAEEPAVEVTLLI